MSNLSFLNKEQLRTGFGQDISMAKTVDEALELAGLNWTVEQRPIMFPDAYGNLIQMENQVANVRVEDNRPLGVVTEKYKVCQNREAFDFIDNLISDGSVSFTMAGSFRGGRSVWIQGIINGYDEILGDEIIKYVLFTNSHDGTGSIRTLFTPVRLVCSNAINFAIKKAIRSWNCVHTGNLEDKLINAQNTLLLADDYMDALKNDVEVLSSINLTDNDVQDILINLFPDGNTERTQENAELTRGLITQVYENKDDLVGMDRTAYRFINAVSDYVTHATPLRQTQTYNERLFRKVAEGHPVIDKAYSLVKQIAA